MISRFELFTVLIAKISRSIRKIKSNEMSKFDLKTPHVSCLYYIYSSENVTLKKLGELCQEDKAALSRSIDYLQNNGYIENIDEDSPKKYKNVIKLTKKGQEMGKYIADRIGNILTVSAKGLTNEELVVFYRGLQTISNNLYCISKDRDQV